MSKILQTNVSIVVVLLQGFITLSDSFKLSKVHFTVIYWVPKRKEGGTVISFKIVYLFHIMVVFYNDILYKYFVVSVI